MRYPRVLHLIGSLEPGGTERQLVEFIHRSRAPTAHSVVVFQQLGELSSAIPSPPFVVGPIDRSMGGVPSVLRVATQLRRLIREHRPDIVHAHLGSSELLAALAMPSGPQLVASQRGRTPFLEDSRLGRSLIAAARRRERILICNSEELARRASSAKGAPIPVVIHNGVDLSRFTPQPFPDVPPTVAVVARLRPEKGHDRFLRAFRQVATRLPEARAILVGDGPERQRLEALTSDLGLAKAVRFVGRVADVGPHIAAAHAVVLTSPHEGFPNALLEGMACGRPVVATAVGGVPELVTDAREGLLTALDDAAIADAIVHVLTDAEARDRMGTAARARATDFDWDTTVDRLEAVYEGVVRSGDHEPVGTRGSAA